MLKERLRSDLTAAMKARDQVRVATLRMALTAVSNAETTVESQDNEHYRKVAKSRGDVSLTLVY